jgi:hypothetical protein
MITLSKAHIHPYTINFLRRIKEMSGDDLLVYEMNAIDNLVKDLVAYDIWDRMVALFPFVGRTAIPHSINLINPALYQIGWVGGITHNHLGITGNGSTGTGDARVNPGTDSSFINSMTFGVYSLTDGTSSGVDLGAQAATNLHIKFTDNNGYFDNCFSSGRISVAMGSTLGLILSSRVSSSDHGGWKNGTKIIWGSGAQSTITSAPFTILSRAGSSLFVARTLAMVVIGYGLTDNQNLNFYRAVQAFQTLLNRAV